MTNLQSLTAKEDLKYSNSTQKSKPNALTAGQNTALTKFAKARADEWHDRADKLAEKVKNAESNSSENVAKSSKGDILKEESKERFSGRYSASQERIDQLIQDDLSGINFTEKPVYNSRIRSNGKTTVREFADGTVKEVVKVEIGKQDNSSAEFLEDSILHRTIL